MSAEIIEKIRNKFIQTFSNFSATQYFCQPTCPQHSSTPRDSARLTAETFRSKKKKKFIIGEVIVYRQLFPRRSSNFSATNTLQLLSRITSRPRLLRNFSNLSRNFLRRNDFLSRRIIFSVNFSPPQTLFLLADDEIYTVNFFASFKLL